MPSPYSFPRYLSAKKTVDDRALSRTVWETLRAAANELPAAAALQTLEVGAGIGTMLERLLDWGLHPRLDYTGIDAQAENVAHAHSRLPAWARQAGFAVAGPAAGDWRFTRPDREAVARFLPAELYEFAARPQEWGRYDLLIAHAFLDLLDIPRALPVLLRFLRPGGLFYFTINFDGATLFEPAIDPALDEQIERLYHRTMDERLIAGRRSGDSRAGRHLFAHLRSAGAELLAAGPSDWVVFGAAQGYPADEAYFLHFIVDTLRGALAGLPELDQAAFERWIACRHGQVDSGELVYVAHQLDFCGRAPIP